MGYKWGKLKICLFSKDIPCAKISPAPCSEKVEIVYWKEYSSKNCYITEKKISFETESLFVFPRAGIYMT